MGLLDFLRGMPTWASRLPPRSRPSPKQISELETLRHAAGVSTTEFYLHIASHPETTRRVQKDIYNQIRQQQPDASEADVLKQVILSRLAALIGAGADLFDLSAQEAAGGDVDAEFDRLVRRYNSLDSLVAAMIKYEEDSGHRVPGAPEFADTARRVTEILGSE